MRGHVESVRREAAGSVLATALAPSDTIVEVESARDFSDDGQTHAVTVGATSLAYNGVLWADEPADGVSVDTLVLTGAAGITAAARTTRVDVPGSVEYIAQVRMVGTLVAEDAYIEPHVFASDKRSLKVAAVSDGALVKCEREGGRLWLKRVLAREPRIDGRYISAGTALSSVVDLTDPDWATLILGIIGPVGGGSAGNIAGGEWGDTYSTASSGGGAWGDTYA